MPGEILRQLLGGRLVSMDFFSRDGHDANTLGHFYALERIRYCTAAVRLKSQATTAVSSWN